ncbi:unnamed protein product [Kuraishia capsulata CBS 1993]|uniref:Ribosomal RNA-processing protein 42 n=1 Tax=Kuraishia capsulata CBS 1993 TaxID=1382522 RepID=W6MIS3_9ASCO|nr:uncharacterized protein KUCA_T00002022001 [Kuraishia capsulata CBS 1993]CDK26051.1 unnamed protein product [Kuraishia capsulata CBS 1993]
MVLSTTERYYLLECLSGSKVIRADARRVDQFRPVEATCSFLPNSNGSSRVRLPDGSECIASVKAKVVKVESSEVTDLLNVEVDINGQRDDAEAVVSFSSILKESLAQCIPESLLKLTEKYAFELSIDAIVISYPSGISSFYSILTLVSMAVYLALKSTSLPLLTSTTEDAEVEEEPTFSDDWDLAKLLFPKDRLLAPPLLFVLAMVGPNLLLDPSVEELEVAENGLFVGFASNKAGAPIRSISLNSTNNKGLSTNHILDAVSTVDSVGGSVLKALNSIVENSTSEF